MSQASRILAEKTFKYAGYGVATKAAQAWCVEVVAAHQKLYEQEGAEIFARDNGMEFSTAGGDFVRASWKWVSDEDEADVVAVVEGSDF